MARALNQMSATQTERSAQVDQTSMSGTSRYGHTRLATCALRLRHDHGVDDVDHAVRRSHVRLADRSIVDLDGPATGVDRDGATLNRLGRRLALDVTGHHLPGHHVVS